jgi:hypothetical protein
VPGDHDILSESENLTNNTLGLKSLSFRPIPAQLLSSDGWVRNADGLLFWVPEDCREGLICPAIITIPTTGRQGVFESTLLVSSRRADTVYTYATSKFEPRAFWMNCVEPARVRMSERTNVFAPV